MALLLIYFALLVISTLIIIMFVVQAKNYNNIINYISSKPEYYFDICNDNLFKIQDRINQMSLKGWTFVEGVKTSINNKPRLCLVFTRKKLLDSNTNNNKTHIKSHCNGKDKICNNKLENTFSN